MGLKEGLAALFGKKPNTGLSEELMSNGDQKTQDDLGQGGGVVKGGSGDEGSDYHSMDGDTTASETDSNVSEHEKSQVKDSLFSFFKYKTDIKGEHKKGTIVEPLLSDDERKEAGNDTTPHG